MCRAIRSSGRRRPWHRPAGSAASGRSSPDSESRTASRSASTADGRTRLTVQPPNPAPVIRAAMTPSTDVAISTIASSSGELTSNRSRSEAWLSREQATDRGEVVQPRGRRPSPATRAFSVTMCRRAANGDGVEPVPGCLERVGRHVAEAPDAAGRRGPARRRPARTGAGARCTPSRRDDAASPCGRRRASRRPAAGSARQSSDRQSSSTAEPATPHASANWSISPLWTPT